MTSSSSSTSPPPLLMNNHDGMSPIEIYQATLLSCRFIKRVCARLKVNLMATCTAQVFFHRFFARQSLRRHDKLVVAITCVFLGAKVEENLQRLEEVLKASLFVLSTPEFSGFNNVHNSSSASSSGGGGAASSSSTTSSSLGQPPAAGESNTSPALESRATPVPSTNAPITTTNNTSAAANNNNQLTPLETDRERLREKVLVCERILLHTMSFDIMVEHSHPLVEKMMSLIIPSGSEATKSIVFNILNDALSTNACLRYPPRLLAAGAICLACTFLKSAPVPPPATSSSSSSTLSGISASNRKFMLENLANMFKRDEVFGFRGDVVLGVEEELVAFYEDYFKAFYPEPSSTGASSNQTSGTAGDLSDPSSTKRARMSVASEAATS